MTIVTKMDENITFNDATLFYKHFLRYIGLIPFEGRDFSFLPSRFLTTMCVISSILHWSMYIGHIINVGYLTIEVLCEAVVVCGLGARYYLLISKRLEIVELFQECNKLWNLCDNIEHRTVIKYERKMRKLFKCLFFSCLLLTMLYPIVALNVTLPPLEPNGTERRMLPIKWYNEDPENKWPGYWAIFFYQIIVIFNNAILTVTIDCVAPLFIMMGCGYLHSLQDRFYLTTETDEDKFTDNYMNYHLMEFMKFHQVTLNFCMRIDRLTKWYFFAIILINGYNMSLVGIKLSDPNKDKYISLMMIIIVQLYIVQWAPDHLIDESREVSTAAYAASFNWMKRRIGKYFVLIIARAQKPVQLTAGGIVNLSMENFGSMLTSAVSFFTVLRSFET